MFSKLLALLLLILLSPLFFLLFVLVKLSSKGPFIFKQLRSGKNKKPFLIYKIRTMVENAEELKNKYTHLNEADGPVFKIKNDPRYTKIGKILSHSGLDELPQLVNIIKGDMSFVGPRPFPIEEAEKIPKKYFKRFSVMPGLISSWIFKGGHSLSFNQWMNLDLEYIKDQTLLNKISILIKCCSYFLNY